MVRTCALMLCLLVPTVLPCGPARAAIPDLTWGEVEVVDAPVVDLPSGSGASIVLFEGTWYLAYVKTGQVWLARRAASGWLPPLAMTQSPAVPSDPRLAVGGGALHLVWQDDRSGHPEVWTRRSASGVWTAETSLTNDAVPSLGPVIAGLSGSACVVWQEDVGSAARIQSRRFAGGGWAPSEAVSLGSAAATEPTVSASSEDFAYQYFYVAWTDARHGETEIYRRRGESTWDAEARLTNLAGACRKPSIHNEACCSDNIVPACLVAFEYVEPSGVTETWTAAETYGTPEVTRLSSNDGIPSELPGTSGNQYDAALCWFGGGFPRYWITWTDQVAPGVRSVRLARTYESGDEMGTEDLSDIATSRSLVGGGEGSPDGVLVAWCELREGTPTLLARRGTVPRCLIAGLRQPPSLLVAPEGTPANVLQRIDTCSGDELSGAGSSFGLEFSAPLDAALRWDPLQGHPMVEAYSDAQGRVVFPLRGGGCSQAGGAVVRCQVYGPIDAQWNGAKSPDVNGDCAVRLDDLHYVQSRLGSADFCADLDGSGLVDAADVAIVQSTLGDHCSDVTATDGPVLPGVLALSVSPNPARTGTTLRLAGAIGDRATFRVVDVGGRLVRSAEVPVDRGSALWTWDTRDDSGRWVASGLYTVRGEVDGRVVRRSALVLR